MIQCFLWDYITIKVTGRVAWDPTVLLSSWISHYLCHIFFYFFLIYFHAIHSEMWNKSSSTWKSERAYLPNGPYPSVPLHSTVLGLMFYIRCWECKAHKICVLSIMQCNVILWQLSVTDVFKSIGNISHLILTMSLLYLYMIVAFSLIFFLSVFFCYFSYSMFFIAMLPHFICSFRSFNSFHMHSYTSCIPRSHLMYLRLMTQFILTHKLLQSDDRFP